MPILTTQEQKWVDTKLAELQSQQSSYAALYAKYQQMQKTVYGNITVEAHELVSPDGQVGYIVILYKTVNGIVYFRTYGFGKDSALNTHDWAEYKFNM